MAAGKNQKIGKVYSEKKEVIVAVFLVALISLSSLTFLPSTIGDSNPWLIRVACVGDSITSGTEYPRNLQRLLGPRYQIANFGHGGSTVMLSADKPYIGQNECQQAISYDPDIVIIMLGTNDANPWFYGKIDRFTEDYKLLISYFQDKSVKIWLVKPPPIFSDALGPKGENLVTGVLPRIQQVADELRLPVIDVYTPMLTYPDYYWDGVHPDWQGSKVIANTVYHAILAR